MTGASSQHEELYSRVTALGSLRTIALEDEDSPFTARGSGVQSFCSHSTQRLGETIETGFAM